MDQELELIMKMQEQMQLINTILQDEMNILSLKVELGLYDDLKVVDNFPNYAVSDKGNVYNVKTKRKLKNNWIERYFYVVLYNKVTGKNKSWLVHRLVAFAFIENPNGKPCVDHINGNRFDNSKKNLRWVTIRENGMNQVKHKNSISIYKGVSFKKQNKLFRAHISINGRLTHLGYFKNEIDAAKAYNEAAALHFGEFARLNII